MPFTTYNSRCWPPSSPCFYCKPRPPGARHRPGGGGGPSTSFSNPNPGAQAQQTTIRVEAVFKLRGEDLVAVGRLGAYRNTLTS